MDPTVKLIFFIVALVLFVVNAVAGQKGPVNLNSLGGIALSIPLVWDTAEFVAES